MLTMHTDATGQRLVDLGVTFGKRFRVTREPDGATWHQWPEEDRPWLLEIRGHAGTVSPFGGELLQAHTGRPGAARRLLALPFLAARRGGCRRGEECTVRFHIDDAEVVFEIIRPRRRRTLSETHRAKLIAAGAQALARHRETGNSGNGVIGPSFDASDPVRASSRNGVATSIPPDSVGDSQ